MSNAVRAATAVLALGLPLLAPVTPAAAVQPNVPELAGVSVLSGDRPSRIAVHLDRPATLHNPLLVGSGLEVRGSGDFVGFVLAERDADDDGRVVIGGRLPRTAGSELFLMDISFFADGFSEREVQLDPGTYDMYLIPGSGRAEVRLHLDGVEGKVTLRPTEQVAYESKPMEPLDTGGSATVRAGAAIGKIVGDGVLFQAVWFRNAGHAVTNYDACLWKGRAREPWAYLPGCGDSMAYEPEGGRASHGTTDFGPSAGDNVRLHYGAWVARDVAARGGKFGQSFDMQTASAITSLDSLAIWLSY